MWTRVKNILKNNFTKSVYLLDYRSLALFRIGLGIVLILDLALRLSDFTAFYTDLGVLPRGPYMERTDVHSLYFLSGHFIWPAILFFASFTFGVFLIVGYKTRLSAIATWILLLSLHNRNIFINIGDIYFRFIVFWSIFLPLGACYSIDSYLSKEKIKNWNYTSAPAFGISLQIFLLYACAGFMKTGNEWWPDGSAVYYAMSAGQYASPFGKWLLSFSQESLALMTWGVLWWERLGSFMLFIPFFFGPVRTFIVFLFVFMHLCFEPTLNIGLFQWFCIVALTVLLPSFFWEKTSLLFKGEVQKVSQILSKNKKLFSKWKGSSLFPVTKSHFIKNNSLENAIATFFICYILAWNLSYMPWTQYTLPNWARLKTLGLTHKWTMFAPAPTKNNVWFILEGRLSNGQTIDLWRDKKTDYSKTYARWYSYFVNLIKKQGAAYRPYFGSFVCREWNADERKPELLSFNLYFMRHQNNPPNKRHEPVRVHKERILHYRCHSKPPRS